MPSTPMYGLHIVKQDTRWFIVNNKETNQQPNIANWALVGDLFWLSRRSNSEARPQAHV